MLDVPCCGRSAGGSVGFDFFASRQARCQKSKSSHHEFDISEISLRMNSYCLYAKKVRVVCFSNRRVEIEMRLRNKMEERLAERQRRPYANRNAWVRR